MIFALVAVLIIIIIVISILFLSYRRQVKEICRQLQLVSEHESNLIIQNIGNFKSIVKLADEINRFLMILKKDRSKFMKKEKAISDVYTNLSHDIRTPLTSLDGYVGLLSESSNEEEKNRYLAVVRERINCLKEMLEELFTFTKLKNETWQLELTNCSFNRILTETLVSYYDEWKNKGIIPVISIPEKTAHFAGNEAAMKRVLQNILKNALEHGEKQLKVVLNTDDNIHLEIGNVLNDNVFIDVDKVFDRFYKADEARSKTSSGLGLSIAKEFVLRMNGKIYARQEKEWFYIVVEFPSAN